MSSEPVQRRESRAVGASGTHSGRESDQGGPSEPTPANTRRAEAKRLDRIGWRLAGVAWEFSSQVLAGVLLGWGIDWFFQTTPWGIVGGAAAGLSVGTLQFIRHAMKLNREMGPVSKPPGGWKNDPTAEVLEGGPEAGDPRARPTPPKKGAGDVE